MWYILKLDGQTYEIVHKFSFAKSNQVVSFITQILYSSQLYRGIKHFIIRRGAHYIQNSP